MSNGNWVSSTESTIGTQLLKGGKALMSSIYDLKQGAEDYLPESYTATDDSSKLTRYEHHVSNKTSVFWSNPFLWECAKGGKVSDANTATGTTNPSDYLVSTDCSGFITSLFAYCNKVGNVTTKFSQWDLNEQIPQADDFFSSIQSGQGFQSLTLSEVQPGDLITFEYHTKKHKDTGHIMLVVAVQAQNDGSVKVVVMDESVNEHTDDTRQSFEGLGMGYALLSMGGETLQFLWGTAKGSTIEYPVQLGRAL